MSTKLLCYQCYYYISNGGFKHILQQKAVVYKLHYKKYYFVQFHLSIRNSSCKSLSNFIRNNGAKVSLELASHFRWKGRRVLCIFGF